jgi:hypothetical protein
VKNGKNTKTGEQAVKRTKHEKHCGKNGEQQGNS